MRLLLLYTAVDVRRPDITDYAHWQQILAVNVLAQMNIVEAFIEHVAASEQTKIATLSSDLGSISDNTRGELPPASRTRHRPAGTCERFATTLISRCAEMPAP